MFSITRVVRIPINRLPRAARMMFSTNGVNPTGEALPVVKKNFVLQYHYVDNMLAKRDPYRPGHLEHTRKHIEQNLLMAGGGFLPDIKRGMLLFRCPEKATVEEFAKNDPFVQGGLVTHYEIFEWGILVGGIEPSSSSK